MNKALEKIRKEIKAVEDSRKQFIAKFENSINAVDEEIRQAEENLKQSIAADDFDAFEDVSDRLAFLQKKKKHLEDGLYDAKTTAIGDYDKMRLEIRDAVNTAARAKVKELVQHTEAMESIGREIEALRTEGNQILKAIEGWSDHPQNSLSLDDSAGVVRWALRPGVDGMYQATVKEHPEWSKLK